MLGLLKFEDDRVVFDDDELEIIAKRIGECLGKRTPLVGKLEEMGGYYVYPIEKWENQELDLDKRNSKSVTIESAQIGYYHHRVIMHFRLNSESSLDFSALRDVRKKIEQVANPIIEKCVVNEIEKLASKNSIRKEGEVKYCYRYPLIIVKKSKRKFQWKGTSFLFLVKNFFMKILKSLQSKIFGTTYPGTISIIPFSEQTTSSCFDISEPTKGLLFNKRHIIRISIPGTILYTQGKPSESLLRDIINAIYQYCLYEKKLKDGNGPFSNELDETLLVNLWKHIIDTMGGRTPDVYTARIASTTLFLTIFVIVLYILTIFNKFIPAWASFIIVLASIGFFFGFRQILVNT